ncbi:hypothetical protein AUP68_09593 [Ilyonectria robusta]
MKFAILKIGCDGMSVRREVGLLTMGDVSLPYILLLGIRLLSQGC